METPHRLTKVLHTIFQIVKESFQAGYYYILAMDGEKKTWVILSSPK